jgi:peptidoglycan hydrolase-like protein with peptidoglycan-binding domain
LDNQGYNAGTADGYYGPVTRGAIMQYQTDHGMTADGKLTPDLLKSLGVADPNQLQGQPPPAQNNQLPPPQNEQPAPDQNTQPQQ